MQENSKKCVRCKETVYQQEWINAGDENYYHRTCFKCAACKRAFNSAQDFLSDNGVPFCKGKCYDEQIRISKGLAPEVELEKETKPPIVGVVGEVGGIKAVPQTPALPTADPKRCPRCNKTAYPQEAIPGTQFGFYWHKECFKCVSCNRTINPSLQEAVFHTDGKLYCIGKCIEEQIRKEKGIAEPPRRAGSEADGGGGSSSSAADEESSEGEEDPAPVVPEKPVVYPLPTDPNKCPKCNKTVYPQEAVASGLQFGYKWHKPCFKCTTCNRALNPGTTSVLHTNNLLYCAGKCVEEQIRKEKGIAEPKK